MRSSLAASSYSWPDPLHTSLRETLPDFSFGLSGLLSASSHPSLPLHPSLTMALSGLLFGPLAVALFGSLPLALFGPLAVALFGPLAVALFGALAVALFGPLAVALF